MEKRFENTFKSLSERHEGAFMPFVTLCDPDYDTSLKILKTMVESGANCLELGFPFSDPCADGPTIQYADKRALSSGAVTADFFKLIKELRQLYPSLPMSILVYANVVVAHGIDNFFKYAQDSGLDAVLIPDIPVNMLHTCEDFVACAQRHEIDTVLIAPPNADEKTLEDIAKYSQGYTYVLSRFGITGVENTFGKPVQVIERIKQLNGAAPVLGFGISTPEHIKQALATGACGAIAGSACVKIIEENLGNVDEMLTKISTYVKDMKSATKL